ncbi:MAG: NADH-quinone oxidoreductase subunit N [Planctomycetota bacterium]
MTLEFTEAEIRAILPSAILFLTGLVQLLTDACLGARDPEGDRGQKSHLVLTGAAGSVLAFIALGALTDPSAPLFSGALTGDLLGRFAAGIIIVTTLLTGLGAGGYLGAIGRNRGEFHALLSFGAGAMVLLAQSANLVAMFVAVETLSLALYVLAGYVRDWRESSEGAFKYFVMGAFSSGFLLLGMAFLYGGSGGGIDLAALGGHGDEPLIAVGAVLVLIGLGFKVGAVPFHSWVPDVYQGTPMLAAGWMAVAVKVCCFVALIRIILATGGNTGVASLVEALAVVTILLGNLAALNQTNLKRMLAYSGIAHTGYLMVPLVLVLASHGDGAALSGSLFYLATYLVTTLAAFTALSTLQQGDRDCDTIDSIRGLGRKHPVVALVITLSMVSLAGIPLTAGFMGKFTIFSDAVAGGKWHLALIGVIGSMISVYYYLRPIVAMYFHEALEETEKAEAAWGLHLAMLLLSVGILYLGLFPESIVSLSRGAVPLLAGH